VGGIGVLIIVSVGISVLVGVTGAVPVSSARGILVKGGVKIIGVAVTILGVREGIADKVGAVRGDTSYISHAPRKITRINRTDNFFMVGLFRSGFSVRGV